METLAHLAHEAVAAIPPRDAAAPPLSSSVAAAHHAAAAAAAARASSTFHPAISSNGQRDEHHQMAPEGDGLPGSQESYVSASSIASTVPRLHSSQSNLSSESVADTELTSPSTSNASQTLFKSSQSILPAEASGAADQLRVPRPVTPQIDSIPQDGAPNASAVTSPMSVDTPTLAQGSKRTASGRVKFATAGNQGRTGGAHSRTGSLELSVNRIGQLSAELKTRLSYAMIKVQNGWEQKSIDELESVASQRTSPSIQTPTSTHFRGTTDSPRSYDRPRRLSGFSGVSDRYAASPAFGQGSPPNVPPLLGQYSSSMPAPEIHIRPSTASTVSSNASTAPSLAAPAEIVPRRNRRSISTHVPPMLSTQKAPRPVTDAGVPTTPTGKSRPAGFLRMPSQQAEMDAVDSLLFMSSPNNSAHFAHTSATSTAQPSPLRSEFAVTKKVAFDDQSISSGGASENETTSRPPQDAGTGAASPGGGGGDADAAAKRARAEALGGGRESADSG